MLSLDNYTTMKAQITFPTIIVGIAVIIIGVLMVYSITSLTTSASPHNVTQTTTLDMQEDLTYLSYIQQLNTNSNCPYTEGPDSDGDGIIDLCDNCPYHYNPLQEDSNKNGFGDVCDVIYNKTKSSGTSVKDDEEDEGECASNSDCGTDGFINDPFCSSHNVARNYVNFVCEKPGTKNSKCIQNITVKIIEACNETCEKGKCVAFPANITCSKDSDCGVSGFIGDKFCAGLNVVQSYANYTCLNKGTPQSSCLLNITNKTIEVCKESCSNGVCATLPIICRTNADCNDSNPLTFDECVNPGTPKSYCTNTPISCVSNSDCGTDGFINDPFCLGLDIFKKFRTFNCQNPGTLQSKCTFTDKDQLVQTCPDACVDGKCVSIECRANIDCGTNQFEGEAFCIGNSIFKMLREYLCVFPGLPISYCSSQTLPHFIDECDYACLSGECIRCSTNAHCDDNNASTEDICMLPNTPFSYCVNNPIITCQDECIAGQRKCVNNGYQVCGNYDPDQCTEWSQTTQCSFGEVCKNGFCIPK